MVTTHGHRDKYGFNLNSLGVEAIHYLVDKQSELSYVLFGNGQKTYLETIVGESIRGGVVVDKPFNDVKSLPPHDIFRLFYPETNPDSFLNHDLYDPLNDLIGDFAEDE